LHLNLFNYFKSKQTKMQLEEAISRKDFLKGIGISGAALMAVLTSCTNSTDVTPSSSGSIDLNNALKNIGDYTYSGNIIVARIAAGNTASSFVALAKACTHEGTTVVHQGTGFYCPNHGATFSNSGAVTGGPASRSLTKYTVTISGTALTVA
jgi:cytochrome b6-f complex iron-sulfur subunit